MNTGEEREPLARAEDQLRNREHAKGERRRQRTTVHFTDTEWALIVSVAAVDNLRPGAWVAQVSYDLAKARMRGVPTDRRALVAAAEQVRSMRNVLANIGGNLNDVARHANSTHEVETIRAQALGVLRIVHRVVQEADRILAEVSGVLRS